MEMSRDNQSVWLNLLGQTVDGLFKSSESWSEYGFCGALYLLRALVGVLVAWAMESIEVERLPADIMLGKFSAYRQASWECFGFYIDNHIGFCYTTF